MNMTSSAQTEDEQSSCIELSVHEIVFSRTTLIIVLTLCVAITGISVIGISALGYRTWTRHQQDNEARGRGRSPHYQQHIPMIRKEVDDSYSRQHSRNPVNEPKNPFLTPRSPVELMQSEVWEAPDTTVNSEPTTTTTTTNEREAKVESLFFDGAKGQWLYRHN